MKKFANALAVRHKVGLSSFFMLCIISKPHSPYHRIYMNQVVTYCAEPDSLTMVPRSQDAVIYD